MWNASRFLNWSLCVINVISSFEYSVIVSVRFDYIYKEYAYWYFECIKLSVENHSDDNKIYKGYTKKSGIKGLKRNEVKTGHEKRVSMSVNSRIIHLTDPSHLQHATRRVFWKENGMFFRWWWSWYKMRNTCTCAFYDY